MKTGQGQMLNQSLFTEIDHAKHVQGPEILDSSSSHRLWPSFQDDTQCSYLISVTQAFEMIPEIRCESPIPITENPKSSYLMSCYYHCSSTTLANFVYGSSPLLPEVTDFVKSIYNQPRCPDGLDVRP
ncbi:hypothetical protein Tco_0575652 [Tanacetum coccineum]